MQAKLRRRLLMLIRSSPLHGSELKAYLRRSLHDHLCSIFLCTNLRENEEEYERDVQVKIFHGRQKPFPEFNNLQLLTLLSNSVTNRSCSLVYSQQDLRSINLFSNSWWLVHAESARVIKTRHGGFGGSAF